MKGNSTIHLIDYFVASRLYAVNKGRIFDTFSHNPSSQQHQVSKMGRIKGFQCEMGKSFREISHFSRNKFFSPKISLLRISFVEKKDKMPFSGNFACFCYARFRKKVRETKFFFAKFLIFSLRFSFTGNIFSFFCF